jgi:DNA-directed RNA polymerase specialized sigma24 family protein
VKTGGEVGVVDLAGHAPPPTRGREVGRMMVVAWHDEISQSELAVMAALGKLPDRQRAAVVLHLGAGFSLREVAAILSFDCGSPQNAALPWEVAPESWLG